MVGNTLIVKHASNVPRCALAFEKLFLNAGAPVGAYTNVFISNEQCATAIADRRMSDVNYFFRSTTITFTAQRQLPC